MPESANPAKLHLWLWQRNLWNVPQEASHQDQATPQPEKNGWTQSSTKAIIKNGLRVVINTWHHVFAEFGFPISPELSRKDEYPGTIVYYYEVTQTSPGMDFLIGLSDGSVPADGARIGTSTAPNSYALWSSYYHDYPRSVPCFLSGGKKHRFERPDLGPDGRLFYPNGAGDVIGCGLLLDSKNQLSIFFTLNGILYCKQIPISTSADCLYPTICMYLVSIEANFGDDLVAKPFKYDVNKCPGLVIDEIH